MSGYDENNDKPKKRAELSIGGDLATISLEELEERICLLEAEISRIRAEIAAKHSSRASAESFFKS